MGLGVAIKVIGSGGLHPDGWVRYIKCEKFDHNVARTLPIINFFDATNIPLDFGRQVQGAHITGQCSEEVEVSDGQTLATKTELEDFAWKDYKVTTSAAGGLRVYWVEGGAWFYLEGCVSALTFDHDPANEKWWNFRLDIQGASKSQVGNLLTGKQPGNP